MPNKELPREGAARRSIYREEEQFYVKEPQGEGATRTSTLKENKSPGQGQRIRLEEEGGKIDRYLFREVVSLNST